MSVVGFGTTKTTTDTLLFQNFKTVSLFSDFAEIIGNGNLNNQDVWSVGRKPLSSEYVKINQGHTVTVGQDITLKNITLQGNLQFTGIIKSNCFGVIKK